MIDNISSSRLALILCCHHILCCLVERASTPLLLRTWKLLNADGQYCAEHHDGHHSHDHTHDPGVSSVSIVCEGNLDLEKVGFDWCFFYSNRLLYFELSALETYEIRCRRNWCSVPMVWQANIWLGTLLMERSEDIYRMKGLLSVKGMPERFVFQVTVCFHGQSMSCSFTSASK